MNLSLYSEQLMSHHRDPVGWCDDVSNEYQTTRHNAFCGDELILGFDFKGGKLTQVSFSGECCAVCRSSASMLCQTLNAKELALSEQLVTSVLSALKTEASELPESLAALQAVKAYPVRVQCARLPWLAMNEALKQICRQPQVEGVEQ